MPTALVSSQELFEFLNLIECSGDREALVGRRPIQFVSVCFYFEVRTSQSNHRGEGGHRVRRIYISATSLPSPKKPHQDTESTITSSA